MFSDKSHSAYSASRAICPPFPLILQIVDDDQYREIVRNRRKQSDFVVDDDGSGYYDDGEEHLFNADLDAPAGGAGSSGSKSSRAPQFRGAGAMELNSKGRKKKGGGGLSMAALARGREQAREKHAASAAGTKNIGAMFLGMSKKGVSASAGPNKQSSADFDLDSMLDDLMDGSGVESLASMSRNNTKMKSNLQGRNSARPNLKRKVGSVLYGGSGKNTDLVNSPSGASVKKAPRVSFADNEINSSSRSSSSSSSPFSLSSSSGMNESMPGSMSVDHDDDDGGFQDDFQEEPAASVNEAAAEVKPQTEAEKKRSRFIEFQRKRSLEKKKKLEAERVKVAARAAAAQEATRRAVSAQNAAIDTTRGKGGWWDQSSQR